MLRYLSMDIIRSSKLTVFLELRSRKTVRFSEQIISEDKYPSIFSRQMKAIVYIYTPVFKNVANSKHVYHIYNSAFSAPVSFLSAPEKTHKNEIFI